MRARLSAGLSTLPFESIFAWPLTTFTSRPHASFRQEPSATWSTFAPAPSTDPVAAGSSVFRTTPNERTIS